MMTLREIDKILEGLARKWTRQNEALQQTDREVTAWKDLRSAKEKEKATKP